MKGVVRPQACLLLSPIIMPNQSAVRLARLGSLVPIQQAQNSPFRLVVIRRCNRVVIGMSDSTLISLARFMSSEASENLEYHLISAMVFSQSMKMPTGTFSATERWRIK